MLVMDLETFKVGLCHRPNQINEMNDLQGGRCFGSPLK